MTEQEALHMWLMENERRIHLEGGALVEEAWYAALEWARQGQEPVAFARSDQLNKLTRNTNPAGAGFCTLSTKNEQGYDTPLYIHPAQQQDVTELVEVVKELAYSSTEDTSLIERAEQALTKWEGK